MIAIIKNSENGGVVWKTKTEVNGEVALGF